jgi:AraC family transcriptional regulator, ethanolamine operon transcriptional activator
MSPVLVERKVALTGIDVMRKVFELSKMEAISLREGGLRGVLGSCRYLNATLCSFVVDFAFHGRFEPPPGHYVFCYLHQAARGSWCAGMPLHSGTALIVLPGSSCELMVGPESCISTVLAPIHPNVIRVIERSPASFGSPGFQFSLFGSNCHASTGLDARYAAMFESLTGATGGGMAGLVGRGAADALVDARSLDDLLAQAMPASSYACSYRLHYPTLRKAIRFMRAHLHRDIYIDEIAGAVQMSDRSLRNVFDELLSVSPTRYLSLLRLHEASRQLSMHNTGRLSIKAVAMSCGMWDLSRFAANYRRTFGEHPSATRMRTYGLAS